MLANKRSEPAITTASGLPWVMRLEDERVAYAIASAHGIPELVARIIAARGVTVDQAADYLNPTLRNLMPDPSHLKAMDDAVTRVMQAIEKGEKVAVFGDYDVDGATSSALLALYFREIGMPLRIYIPDRMKEGYGPNIKAFDTLIDEGATLIITVDCGTLAFDPIHHAKSRGTDIVVLDHHTAEARLPEALTVNPNRVDDASEHGTLAACGVTFLFLAALNRARRATGANEPDLLSMLDIVALGTVADVVPLKGLNRVLVTQGLKVMAQRRHIGLAALMDVSRLDEPPNTYHLGYLLGPRINAGGRVGESGMGVRLLTATDAAQATALAAELDRYNEERRAIEMSVLDAAMALAETQTNMPVMLLASEGWHAGVIGIVAARVKEKWQRPVAVVALDNGIGKASARTVTGADIAAAVHAAHAMGLIEAGGGHAMAAGFTARADQLDALHGFLCTRLGPAVDDYKAGRKIKLDGWITASGATIELLELIERAGPYGAGNPAPRFAIRDAVPVHRTVMKDKHMRLVLSDPGGKGKLTAVAFNVADTPLGHALATKPRFHLAGELKRNRWQGQESAQFLIDDAAWEG